MSRRDHRRDHSHEHHGHDHPHDHVHIGHNHGDTDHLHSHAHGDAGWEREEELKALSSAFVEGFRHADDKTSYLRLSNIPFRRTGSDGLTMYLVDAKIASTWQVGTASPAFASRELVYLPYPGAMITERETMTFTYVSLTERADVDLVQLIRNRFEA